MLDMLVSHEYIYVNTPQNANFLLILGSSIDSILIMLFLEYNTLSDINKWYWPKKIHFHFLFMEHFSEKI